jgi:Ca-activated chloride channel homolog
MKNLTVLFLLLISLVAFGQEKDKKSDVKPLEIKVNLLISDSKAKVLTDVKPEDFRLFEDGIEQKINSFEKLKSPNIGIVVDNTGSIRDRLDVIIATVNGLIERLPSDAEAFVIRFVDSSKISIEQDWTKNKTALKDAVSQLFVEGGESAVLDAVLLTSEKFTEKPKDILKRNVIILISDCEDFGSFYKKKEVVDSLKNNTDEVYVIKFEAKSNRQPVESPDGLAKSLVNQTNGLVFSPKFTKNNYGEINIALANILNEIQMPYRIGYVSTNQKQGNSERKITIEITNDSKGEKRQVFVRDKIRIPK